MGLDRSYFYERAEAELKLAQRATDPAAVKAHYQLAGYYLDRVYGAGDSPATDRQTGRAMDTVSEKADALLAQLEDAGVIVIRPSAAD
jgi:hypothetical protein